MPLARSLRDGSVSPFSHGVSLIAILERTAGEVGASPTSVPAAALTERELGETHSSVLPTLSETQRTK